ncbi:J domain-containing protein [Ramlibacter sp. 2FC]|uniref:J domain-containing protein n=1 Tax=Ramlibacter sp. 2FC TaxID=2502188 RepID=UPI0010F897A7|nr:J domain-containing protein [Ramlibacter sp. 2FC]
MTTATARAAAPDMDFADEAQAWSGRIDPDELKRPGGLLIAALAQCASERGLTLQQMGKAMGVSFWDISQLRIGFRRLSKLDEDLAQACAEFLDLPPLSVQMLAGLLDPEQALATQPLTAEDIVHARQLAASEPAEVVLAPPKDRSRPLAGAGLDELEALHRDYGSNPAVRQALQEELSARPPARIESLRQAVGGQEAEPAAKAKAREAQPVPALMRCAGCDTRLRIPRLSEPGEIRCPSCKAEYQVEWQASVCLVQQQPAPEEEAESAADEGMDVDQALAVLGLEQGCPWDEVERARRSLRQHYHPDKLGQVSPLVQKLAEDAFKRVNQAYEVLRAQP